MPGCEISLQLETGGSGRYPSRETFKSEEDFLEAMLVFQYRWARRESRARRKVLTDDAGQFRFSHLFGTKARLFANCPKHVHPDGNFIAQREVAVGDTVKFVVSGAAPIKVRVESARLRPDTPVIVNFTALEGKGLSCWRAIKHGMDAQLHVVPGKYAIQAKADGNERLSQKVELEVGPSGVETVLVLSLDAESGVYGKLLFSGAKPRDLSIRAAKVEGTLTDEELLREGRTRSSFSVEYDKAKGAFYWNRSDAGEYVFGVFCNGRLYSAKRVTLSGGKNNVELVVPAPQFETSLTIKVEAPEKYSLENIQFNVRNLQDQQFVAVEVWANGPKDYLLGFVVRNRRSEEIEKIDSAQLSATTYELGTVLAEFRPRIDNSLTLTFGEPAEYNLNITGNPPEGWLNLAVFKGSTNQRVSGNTFTMHNGKRAHRGDPKLQPGTYRFEITSDANDGLVLASVETTLLAGVQVLSMEIPSLSTLRIDAVALKQYKSLSLKQISSGRSRRIDFDENKIAVMGALPPGQYELTRPRTRRDSDGNIVQETETLKTFLVPSAETIVLSD